VTYKRALSEILASGVPIVRAVPAHEGCVRTSHFHSSARGAACGKQAPGRGGCQVLRIEHLLERSVAGLVRRWTANASRLAAHSSARQGFMMDEPLGALDAAFRTTNSVVAAATAGQSWRPRR